jgi:hypothetical protein
VSRTRDALVLFVCVQSQRGSAFHSLHPSLPQPPVGRGLGRLENALRLCQRDAGLFRQVMAGDDGGDDLLRLGIADGDTDEMPLVIRDGQGQGGLG